MILGKKNQKTTPQNNTTKQQQQTKTKLKTQIKISSSHVLIRLLHLRPEVIIILCKAPKNLQLH